MKEENDLDHEISWKLNKNLLKIFIIIYVFCIVSFSLVVILISFITNDYRNTFMSILLIIIIFSILEISCLIYIPDDFPSYYSIHGDRIYYKPIRRIETILFDNIDSVEIAKNKNYIIFNIKPENRVILYINKPDILMVEKLLSKKIIN